MDFFAAQASAHSRTRSLLAAYAIAVLVVIAAIAFVVAASYALFSTDIYSSMPYTERIARRPGMLLGTGLAVLGIISVAALHRMAQLSAGGGAVASSLGATRVTRESTDPKRRRLLNVVEEIAIASGVPVPEVYVLDQEEGINAFAAGFGPADAAITVTRGALERLRRSELAGVIGHEFSHILNGDMRLNTRLAGPLFGLLVIAIAGRFAIRHLRGGSRAAPFAVAALGIMALGYLGVFLGRLLQAAICRQREFLADASSVQFTRDPQALCDALLRIARTPQGTRVDPGAGEDLAHLFFAPSGERLFATHPPLATRILRLDPRFDLERLEGIDRDPPQTGDDVVATPVRGLVEPVPAARSLSSQVGNPGLTAIDYAAALKAALPREIETALARGSTAACLWLAVGLAADPEVRRAQLEHIGAAQGAPVAAAVGALARLLAKVPVVQYLPLLQRALPTLKALPRERRAALAALTTDIAKSDGRITTLEYLLGALASRYLTDQLEPPRAPGTATLADCVPALGTLFATVAAAGRDDPVEARRAYEHGLSAILPQRRPDYAPPDPIRWPVVLDGALAQLVRLRPAAKEMLVDGLGRTLLHDGALLAEEAELVRAVTAVLRCPLPPLLALPDVA